MAVGENVLALAGEFAHVSGTPRSQLAAIDLENGSLLDWNPSPNHSFIDPFSIVVTDRAIAVTGPFTSIGGRYRPKFAVFPLLGAPEIVNNLEDTDVAIHQAVRWSIQVLGEQPFTYQWTFNGAAIPGATGSSFSLANAQPGDAGVYAVIISNSVGTVSGRSFKCRVLEPVSIGQEPVSQAVDLGGTAALTVHASGSEPFAYQWRLNGVNLPGEVFSSVSLSRMEPWQAGSYSVAVANSLGAVSSAPAEVTLRLPALPFSDRFSEAGVIDALEFLGTGDTRPATVELGEPSHAGEEGGKSIWLRWRTPVSGVAALETRGSSFDTLLAVYTGIGLAELQEVAADEDAGGYLTSRVQFSAERDRDYWIAVDGLLGVSGNVVLRGTLSPSAEELPLILATPQDQVVNPGGDVVFQVVASSALPLHYQWFFNGSALPGQTSPVLMLPQVTPEQVGLYWVEMSNAAGVVRTAPVLLQLSSADGSDVAAHDKIGEALVAEPGAALQSLQGRAPTTRKAVLLTPGMAGSKIFGTFGATKEPAEPNHCGRPGGASYWLPLKAAADGLLSISTEGSGFNTLLAVFVAGANGSWREVAADDNSGRDGEDSFLRFGAKGGSVYYVAVDGFNNSKGMVRLGYVLDGPDSLPRARIALPSEGSTASLELVVEGQAGRSYRVQTSTDLFRWANLVTGSLTTVDRFSIEQDHLRTPARFYRVVPVP